MYFLDEKYVIIFKTDNNKMYLKIMCFEFIYSCFYVSESFRLNILWNILDVLLHYTAFRLF